MKDRKVHLTNCSVTKGQNEEDDGIEGNMMEESVFASELEKMFGKEVFGSVVRPPMKKIAVETIASVSENVQARKNSF